MLDNGISKFDIAENFLLLLSIQECKYLEDEQEIIVQISLVCGWGAISSLEVYDILGFLAIWIIVVS